MCSLPGTRVQVTGVELVGESDADACTFEREEFEGSLSTGVLGRTLLTSANLASTQAMMVDNRAVLPIGKPASLHILSHYC
jgi:hypothetical protein